MDTDIPRGHDIRSYAGKTWQCPVSGCKESQYAERGAPPPECPKHHRRMK